jgi:hypothetical protein
MAFPKNGVVEAPKIQPSMFGLLAVAKKHDSTDENKWVRGFSQEWETEVYHVANYDDTDTTTFDIVAAGAVNYFDEIKPFFIEVEEVRSTLGFLGLDRIARIQRQLEAVTQRALEVELWDGAIRKGESHDNRALTASASTILNSGTALSAKRALALLEFTIGQTSDSGEQGVIHMTRDVAAILSSSGNMLYADNGIKTAGGTPVVIGSGYSGTGPDDAAGGAGAASTTNKWIYATGHVCVYLGKTHVVNDNLSQAYDVAGNQNDMRLKAIRPAAVFFDTSIHLAVRVDLSL